MASISSIGAVSWGSSHPLPLTFDLQPQPWFVLGLEVSLMSFFTSELMGWGRSLYENMTGEKTFIPRPVQTCPKPNSPQTIACQSRPAPSSLPQHSYPIPCYNLRRSGLGGVLGGEETGRREGSNERRLLFPNGRQTWRGLAREEPP